MQPNENYNKLNILPNQNHNNLNVYLFFYIAQQFKLIVFKIFFTTYRTRYTIDI